MAEVNPAEPPEVLPIQIKKGDYSIHVFLEEARSVIASEVDGSVDAIV
jgi:hypothetical protein